jgi:hypothetical protein
MAHPTSGLSLTGTSRAQPPSLEKKDSFSFSQVCEKAVVVRPLTKKFCEIAVLVVPSSYSLIVEGDWAADFLRLRPGEFECPILR